MTSSPDSTSSASGSSYRPTADNEPTRLAVQASVRSAFDRQLVNTALTTLDADTCGRGLRVVDVGCADGHLTNLLFADHPAVGRVVGVDADLDATHPFDTSMTFLHGDATSCATTSEVLDVLGGPADLVFSSLVIQHVADPSSMLHNIFEMLRPGGRLVISAPDDQFKAVWPDDGTLRRIINTTAASPGVSDRTCARKLPQWLQTAGFINIRAHSQVVTTTVLDKQQRTAVADTHLSWRPNYLARAVAGGHPELQRTHDQLADDCRALHGKITEGQVNLTAVELRFVATKPELHQDTTVPS